MYNTISIRISSFLGSKFYFLYIMSVISPRWDLFRWYDDIITVMDPGSTKLINPGHYIWYNDTALYDCVIFWRINLKASQRPAQTTIGNILHSCRSSGSVSSLGVNRIQPLTNNQWFWDRLPEYTSLWLKFCQSTGLLNSDGSIGLQICSCPRHGQNCDLILCLFSMWEKYAFCKIWIMTS